MNQITGASLFAAIVFLACCARPAEPPRSADTFISARAESFAQADRNLLDAEQREVFDLVAQEGMNAATKRMADTADLQVVLGWLTLVGVGVTTVFAYRANRLTREALDLSRIATENELRAYIGLKAFVDMMTDELGRHIMRYTFQNFGATHALNVRVNSIIWITTGVSRSAPLPEGYDPEILSKPIEVPPRGEWNSFTGFAAALSQQILHQIENRERAICVYYRIDYEDVFGTRYSSISSDIRSGPNLSIHFHNEAYPPTTINHGGSSKLENTNFRLLWRKWRSRAPGAMSSTVGRHTTQPAP